MKQPATQKEWIRIQAPYLKIWRGNIVYSRCYNHKTFRYNLYHYPNENHINEKTLALLRDDEYYNAQSICQNIANKAEKINKIFNNLLNDGYKNITKDDIDKALVFGHSSMSQPLKVDDGLIASFDEWIKKYNSNKKQKSIQAGQAVSEKEILPGTKDFISTLNLLKDFEYDNYSSNSKIQLKDINDKFITDLIEYCYDERISTEKHKYLTEGNLVNKTIQKRFDCLFQFLKDITNGNIPNGIKKPHLATVERPIIRLDNEEVQALVDLQLNKDHEKVIRDYFLFLCHTGLRFADFYKLDSTYYDAKENLLKLRSNKTFAECQIYLNSTAKNIALKYNWDFHKYTNQALNRGLQDLFAKYNLFEDEVEVEYMQSGRKTYKKKKRELISCHAGRRTFISRLVEQGADIYDIMSCTGHKKVETLKFYIDKFGVARKTRLKNMLEQLDVQTNML